MLPSLATHLYREDFGRARPTVLRSTAFSPAYFLGRKLVWRGFRSRLLMLAGIRNFTREFVVLGEPAVNGRSVCRQLLQSGQQMAFRRLEIGLLAGQDDEHVVGSHLLHRVPSLGLRGTVRASLLGQPERLFRPFTARGQLALFFP